MLTSASTRRVPAEGTWMVESVRTLLSVTTGTNPTDKFRTARELPTTTFPVVVRDVPVFVRLRLAEVVLFLLAMLSSDSPVRELPDP